jgi:hypothetical protein
MLPFAIEEPGTSGTIKLGVISVRISRRCWQREWLKRSTDRQFLPRPAKLPKMPIAR